MRDDIQVIDGINTERPVRLNLVGQYGDSTSKALTKAEALELARDLIRKATGHEFVSVLTK